jgi:hypothetical protein
MKSILKRLVSERARQRVRHLGRLRWIQKWQGIHAGGARVRDNLPYLLFSPEVDSFTYPIANEDELAALLADVLEIDVATVAATIAEAHDCPLLARALRQGWPKVLWLRRNPQPGLPQLASWTVLRLRRPALAVETGILDGMASTVMLVALERNARDGHEGRLVSIDLMPGAGTMVPDWLKDRWEPVAGDSATAIGPAVGDRTIGYFASDSLVDDDHVDRELAAVLARAEPRLVAMTVSAALHSLDRAGAEVRRIQERPRGHFYAGRQVAIGRFT